MSSVHLLSAYTWQIEAAQQMLCLYSHQAFLAAVHGGLADALATFAGPVSIVWPDLQTQSSLFCHICRPSPPMFCCICRYSPRSFALLAGPVPNIWLHLQAQSPSICQIQAAPVGPGQRLCTASSLHGCHKVPSPTHRHQTPPPCPCLMMVCQAAEDSWCRSTLQGCLSSANCSKAELQQRY